MTASIHRDRPLSHLVLALAIAAGVMIPAHAVTIDWVTVGDPGNVADDTTYGAVADSFQIMKYEWTNSQYVDFLNAVDPNGTNPNSIYDSRMGSNVRGGISFTDGNTAGSKYTARTNMGNKPVNYVSWFDAARVANWLFNGATGTSSTETGAYTLNNATSGTAPAVNPGATFYVPTRDQWYKAAYYRSGGTNAGYWDYATQSNTAPTEVTAGGSGDGSGGSTGNSANYNNGADWNSLNGNVTTVGTNGGPSAYGAFDMTGNILEWNDLTGTANSNRELRGGAYSQSASQLSSSYSLTRVSSFEDLIVGFRLASPVAAPIPEIDPAGFGSVAALITGALGLIERRRLKPKAA